MKKIRFICCLGLLLVAVSPQLQAQTAGSAETLPKVYSGSCTVRGRVIDAMTLEPLVGAAVTFGAIADNKSVIVDQKGEFELRNVPRGKEVAMQIRLLGYTEFNRKIVLDQNTINLGVLKMSVKSVELGNIMVKGKLPMAKQRGDTTEFAADAFKVNPDAYAEDLVKKLPGVNVEDNKVTAQGQEVKTVYVDGKKTFGKDPMAALKNLPANAVSNIQVFDEQDEQSRFMGDNTAETQKAMNIITKMGVDGATFARMEAGYGLEDTENRYLVNGTYNYFTEKHQVMANANLNNINRSMFGNGLAVLGSSGGGVSLGMGGGSRMGGYGFGMGNSGTQRIGSVGVNYSGNFNPKFSLENVVYMYNNSDNMTRTSLERTYYPTEKLPERIYNQESLSQTQSSNHQFSGGFNWHPNDRYDWIRFEMNAGLQHNESDSWQRALNRQEGDTINRNVSLSDQISDNYNISSSLSWMHRFRKQGRSVSVRFNMNLNNNDINQHQKDSLAVKQAGLWTETPTNRLNDNLSWSRLYQARFSYGEPIGKYSRVLANYTISYDNSRSERSVYDEPYMTLDESLSNTYTNNVFKQAMGLSYSYNNQKKKFDAGVDYVINDQMKDQVFPREQNMDRLFYSWAPKVLYRYAVNNLKFFEFRYSGQTLLPSVEQLQNVINTQNPLMLSAGNPDLKQGYSHRLNVRYSSAVLEKGSFFYLGFEAQNRINSISNNSYTILQDTTIYDYEIKGADHVRLSIPTNINGYWSVGLNTGYSFKINPLRSNLNLDIAYNYSRTPSLYEQVLNFSNQNSLTLRVAINSNISEKVDFSVSSSSSYNVAQNSSKTDTKYFRESVTAKVNLILPLGFVFRSDVSYSYSYNATTTSYNQSYCLLNAAIGKKFAKDRFEFGVSVNDILGQNKSYQHAMSDNYVEDSRTNVMGRYVLATLSYKFGSLDKLMGSFSNRRGDRLGGGRNHGNRPSLRIPGGRF